MPTVLAAMSVEPFLLAPETYTLWSATAGSVTAQSELPVRSIEALVYTVKIRIKQVKFEQCQLYTTLQLSLLLTYSFSVEFCSVDHNGQ